MKKDVAAFKQLLNAPKKLNFSDIGTPEDKEIERLRATITEQAARIKTLEDALKSLLYADEDCDWAATQRKASRALIGE